MALQRTRSSETGMAQILPVLVLLILVGGLAATMVLTRKPQDNRSRAFSRNDGFTPVPSPSTNPEMLRRADVTGNNQVEITDALFIQRFVENKDQIMGGFGDVDKDGKVTDADAKLVSNYIADLGKLDQEQLRRADVDRDGTVTAADALFIQRFAAGRDQVLGAFGDVNKDGKVTAEDATMIGNAVAGNASFDAEQNRRADVTLDKQVTITDALFVSRFVQGIDKVIGAYGDANLDNAVSSEDANVVTAYVASTAPSPTLAPRGVPTASPVITPLSSPLLR